MPTQEEVFSKVKEVIAKNNNIPPEEITMESTFEEMGMDSLDGISILNDVENLYNITVPNDVATKMKTVREMVVGLHEHISSGQPQPEQTKEYILSQIPKRTDDSTQSSSS